MAEVSTISLVTPKKDESDDAYGSRSSTGNQISLCNRHSTGTYHRKTSVGSNHSGGSSFRSSAEKSESANSPQNVVPRYLRASTGSCHDFCKFGREHSVETNARKPFRRRKGKPSPYELSPVQILVSGGNKKEEVVSGGKKKEEVISGCKKKEEVVSVGKNKIKGVSGGRKKGDVVSGGRKKGEMVSTGEKKEEAVDHGTPTHSNDLSPDTKSCFAKPKASMDKEKATMHKPSTYTNSLSPNVPSDNKSGCLKLKLPSSAETYSSKQNGSSGNKTLPLKRKPSSAKKSPSADPPEIVKSTFFPYTEVADSVKQGSSSDGKISRNVKKTASVAKQQSVPVKLKPIKVKPSLSSDDSDGMRGKGRRNSNAETGRELMTSKASAKKILESPTPMPKLYTNKTTRTKSGKPGNLKIVSSQKDQSKIQRISSNETSNSEEKASEKTLHAFRMETGNDVSECISGDNGISLPPTPSSAKSLACGKYPSSSSEEEEISESEESDVEEDDLISENNDSLETSKEAAVKVINKKTTRTISLAVPEDKLASPVKVKFRMGKVVDLQSDNNTPRKLRFRRGRLLLAEDCKGDLRRKTSKRAGGNGDTAGTVDSSEKVVLKHQDVQGKKDDQGLLNNVIEETASKLAVSRKSKVKALVGAFETVISLQEI